LADGVYAFEIGTTSKQITEIDLSQATPTITAADIASVFMYGCYKNKCVRTYGYITDGSKYYAIKNGSANAEVTSLAASCASIGSLYTGNTLCIDSDTANAQAFISNTSKKNFVLTQGSIFTGATTIPANSGILIRATENAFVWNNFEGINERKYVVKVGNAFKIYSYSSTGSILTKVTTASLDTYDIVNAGNETLYVNVIDNTSDSYANTGAIASLALFDCDSEALCGQTYGYVKTTDARYFSIPAPSGTNAVVSATTSCSAIGDLLTDSGKVCFAGSGTDGGAMADNKEYILTNLENTNIFTKTAITNDSKYIIIKATANSLTLKLEAGVKLRKVTDHVITDADISTISNADGLANHGIYQCGADHVCVKKQGYVIAGASKDKIYDNITAIDNTFAANNAVTCAANTDAGHVKIVNQKLQICDEANTFMELVKDKVYLLNKENTAYKKYYNNNETNTIIIEEEAANGAYCRKNYIIEKTSACDGDPADGSDITVS